MKHQKGFTLIELMIIVAIMGILSAVFIPLYAKHVAEQKLIEDKENAALVAKEKAAKRLSEEEITILSE